MNPIGLYNYTMMKLEEIIAEYLKHPMHNELNMNVELGNKSATIQLTIHESVINLVGILHGAIYFKLIDDACFFAALSARESNFVATSNMTIHYLKPASDGVLIAHAKMITKQGRKYLCECEIKDKDGTIYAYGSGSFIEPKKTYDYQARLKQ